MLRQSIIRTFVFVVFFSIGAAALSGSILCDDLLQYYHSRQFLRAAEESLSRLESLNTDYSTLLRQLREDPDLVKRIAPAMLGIEPESEDAIYPKVTAEQLAAAREALAEYPNQPANDIEMADWVTRFGEPSQRTILFLAGAFLILISFIWFGPAWQRR